MKITKYKNKNLACFQKNELKNIFETAKKIEILNEMKQQGISFDELRGNHEKMENLASIISSKTSDDRDNHEIIFFSK